METMNTAELARLNGLLEKHLRLIQHDVVIRLCFAGVKETDIATDLRMPNREVNRLLSGLRKARKNRTAW